MPLVLCLVQALGLSVVAQGRNHISVLRDEAAAEREDQVTSWPRRFPTFKQIHGPVVSNLASSGLLPGETPAILARHDPMEAEQVVVTHFVVDSGHRAEHNALTIFAGQMPEISSSVRSRSEKTKSCWLLGRQGLRAIRVGVSPMRCGTLLRSGACRWWTYMALSSRVTASKCPQPWTVLRGTLPTTLGTP